MDCVFVFGRARRLEAATRGGGMSEDDAGLEGGAIRVGSEGGAMEKAGTGAEARWAEFMAGNEGGGRLSSVSSSDESWWESRVNVGTAGAFVPSCGVAFGVDCGESCEEMTMPFVDAS